MGLLGQARRTQQPSQFVQVNTQDPLYQGAAVFYPGRGTTRAMGGANVLLTRDGLGFNTSSTADWWYASPVALASLNPTWTILTVLNGTSTNNSASSAATFYCERPNDTQIVKLGLAGNINGAQLVSRDQQGNLFILNGNANIRQDMGRHRVVVGTRRAANDHRIYVDGQFDVKADQNINGSFGPSIAVIGNDPQDTVSSLNGATVALVIVWPRALSDAEIARASQEATYNSLQPSPRRTWMAYAPSVTNTTVTPGAAAMQVTGYAPSVARGVTTTVTPGAGSIAVTGYAPTVSQSLNTQVSPAAGVLQVVGYAPSVMQTASRTVAPVPGSIAVIGYAPTVVRGSSLTIQTGAPATLAVTGYAPTVTQAGNVIPHYAGATIMRLSSVRSTTILGPARLQQTTGFP